MPEKRIGNSGANMPGMGTNSVEKSKDMKKAYKNLFRYIGRYRWIILAASVLSVAGAILNLIGPSKLSEVTDLITEGMNSHIDLALIAEISILLAVLYVIGFALNLSQGWIMAGVTQKISRNMRTDISKKIDRMPLRYFDSHTVGDVLSCVSNDVDTFSQSMNQSFSTLVSSLSLLGGSMIMMFLTNWIMAVMGIAASLIGMLLMTFVISRSQGYFSDQQTELGRIDSQIEEIYSGHNVVKVCNDEKSARKEFHSMNEKLYVCAWKSQFMSGLMMPMMIFIGNFAYVVVCIAGAVLAVRGSITFGTIVAFMLYIRLFTQPLQNLSQAATSAQSMAAACERVFAFLDEEEMEDEHDKTERIARADGNVEFSSVRFGYTPERIIIHDFSACAKAGQKVAIVGPTGAGKTTMVNLLMRFYEISEGKITIDGKVTRGLKRENLRDQFAMVLQDTWIFEGTLRENLVYNKTGISDERLQQVCEAAGLTDFVSCLPDGYDTLISDQTSLSAGQKQLITIARAMLKDAPLLILDEATSSVDTRTEQKVQKAMDALTRGRTSFVIAHRLSTIRNADLILVMEDGDIVESGNHEALLKKNGFYANLYNSQFERNR
jgi:ATP-binding cassette subfamily B multidrug efflux pump